jgi:hypothetical protein
MNSAPTVFSLTFIQKQSGETWAIFNASAEFFRWAALPKGKGCDKQEKAAQDRRQGQFTGTARKLSRIEGDGRFRHGTGNFGSAPRDAGIRCE